MSEIKVNKVTPRVACGTTRSGDSGDTITIPSGATITNLGMATGFGGTGVVSWETGSIKTTGFTAVTGTGYFCNTTAGAFSVTLPLSPAAGDVVGFSDYAQTFDTLNLTLLRNGSNIAGAAIDATLSTAGTAVTLVYVDATKGWIVTDSGNQTDVPTATYLAATGGCITTCGDYKVHTFTGPGAFCVSAVGNCAGSNTVDYLVIAGGGGGGGHAGAGGGAGGYRESPGTASGSYAVSPRGTSPAVALTVSATPHPIIVGGGGPGGNNAQGTQGTNSSFSTITSTGGGGGGGSCSGPTLPGLPGGSGGGGGGGSPGTPAGNGNDPATPVAQGMDGGTGTGPLYVGGGGGGAIVVGTAASGGSSGGPGGDGASSSITFASVQRAGGGGGSIQPPAGGNGAGGAGGGGCGEHSPGPTVDGTINTGGGGGGTHAGPPAPGGQGGSGVVIIRYKYQ